MPDIKRGKEDSEKRNAFMSLIVLIKKAACKSLNNKRNRVCCHKMRLVSSFKEPTCWNNSICKQRPSRYRNGNLVVLIKLSNYCSLKSSN